MSRFAMLSVSVAAFTIATATAAAPRVEIDASWPGVVSHSIETSAGRITVSLPADVRAGDTISGTILAEPAGKSDAARQRNRDTLNGYVYDVADQRVRRAGNVLAFTAPAAGLLTLLVSSADGGKRIANTQFRVGAAEGGAQSNDLPRMGQAGRPQSIPGAFDGDASNTRVSLNEKPAEIIAESPRGVVIRSPDEPVGSGTLRVNEGGIERQGPFNNVAVSLGAEKSVLNRGETTSLSVRVEGLPPNFETGLTQLTLVGSPTIRLEGGNAQTVPLRIDASGNAAFNRQITAVTPGAYEVSALLLARQDPSKRDPLFPDALDMNGIDSVKQLLGLVAGMNDDARTALLQATLKALKARHAGAKDKKTRKWLEKKIKIVEGAMDILGVPR